MFSKVLIFATFVAASVAIDAATSYSKFNDNQNSVQHIQSAAQPAYYPKPAPQYDAKPAYHAPAYSAPAYHAPSYSASAYSAPSYSAPAYSKAYAAPVAKVALPVFKVAKVVAPVAHYNHAPAYYEHEEKNAPAPYEFAYAVEDPHTGDFHSQEEKSDGDHVVGQYSLHEADGTVRIVKYSDEGHGFNAVVERQEHPTEAPVQYKKLVVPVAKASNGYYHY